MQVLRSKGLLGELALKYAGKPIVVMGGGPSLPDDVEKIKDAACWISANEHGAKLRKCDYIVSSDVQHMGLKLPMEEVLRPLGVPVIGAQFFSDYRIHDWRYVANAGMTALLVAHVLGGWPVIAAGFGCYQDGTYYYDKAADNVSSGRPLSFFESRMSRLREVSREAECIRAVSGPLQKHWPAYDPNEQLGRYPESAALMGKQLAEAAKKEAEVFVNYRVTLAKTELPGSQYVVLTGSEADQLIREGKAKPALNGKLLQQPAAKLIPRAKGPPIKVKATRINMVHPYFDIPMRPDSPAVELPYLDSWTKSQCDMGLLEVVT